jgi:hypothetical protein
MEVTASNAKGRTAKNRRMRKTTTEPEEKAQEDKEKEGSKRKRTLRDKPPAPENIPAATAERSRFVSFTLAEIDRSKIKNAPYNPRTIDPDSRARLLKELKSHGLAEALVWNIRTGNLVGGHQRLSILDDLEQGADFRIPVCVIDVDEKEERRKNIALNSPDMMGQYDVEKFTSVVEDIRNLDMTFDVVGDLGLAEITLEAVIGIDPAMYLPPEPSPVIEEMIDEAAKIKEMKALRKQHKAMAREKEEKENARLLIVSIPEELPLETIYRLRKDILTKLGMPSDLRDPFTPLPYLLNP